MRSIVFHNIKFIDIKTQDINKLIKRNGLFLFPSGPGLSSIETAKSYYKSLQRADYVFFDSGLFVLLLLLFKNIRVHKLSGLKYLKLFLNYLKRNKHKSIFCIDANKNLSRSNRLLIKNFGLKKIYNYIAPNYKLKSINDKTLLKKINAVRPNFIITNIGGGTQEVLGLYLKQNLRFKTKIICTGAAISFLTGEQAPIGNYMDKLFLGWFVRILYNPKTFLLRYFFAFKFIIVFFKYIKTIKIKT